ncbi:MAG: condensation domain-containing protein, partial [Chitinophagaceae bacterium]
MFNKIIDLLHTAKKSGIEVSLNENKLQLKVPKDKVIDRLLLDELKSNKEMIIGYLNDSRWRSQKDQLHNSIPVFNRQEADRIPLSFEQESLWFIDRLQGSVQFHVPRVLRLKGELHIQVLEESVREIVQRHEVLRTVIREEDGVGYQQIKSADEWKLQYISGDDFPAHELHIKKCVEELLLEPFDLSKDYMLRLTLVELSPRDHIMVAVMHHIASDGWSMSVLVRELVELYSSKIEKRLPVLEQLPVQYADYAAWQRSYLSGPILENKLAFWKGQLNGIEPLALRTDFVRPAEQSIRGAVVNAKLSRQLTQSLLALSREQGVTLFMTLVTTFKVLLHRYTGQDDICIGSPVAGRQRQELEGLIGFFINALVLRTDLGNDPVFADLLRRVKHKTLQAYEHQDVPFEKIVTVLDIPRDASRNPVFQVRFALQNAPESGTLKLSGLSLETEGSSQELAQIDINLVITEDADGLYISLYYCSDLYKPETMQRMLRHYENLLQAVSNDAHAPISRLNILTPAEEKQLLEVFNDTATAYPHTKTLVKLFTQQAVASPDATAVVAGDKVITYRELNERSNQLAYYLIKLGIQGEDLIPVCMERGWEMIMAILAIWKAGGAYIPIDPKYPAERISYIVKDTDAKVVLVNAREEYQGSTDGVTVVALKNDEENINSEPVTELPVRLTPLNLAYIIYTSGSTGLPKGAMIEQAGMLNHLYAKINELNIDANSRIAQTASCTFDISVWQMFAALVCGGATMVYGDDVIARPHELLKQFDNDGITIAELVPSYLTSVLEESDAADLSGLQYLLVTGEAVNPAVLQKWFEMYPGKTVVNAYGPTEASDDICHYHM